MYKTSYYKAVRRCCATSLLIVFLLFISCTTSTGDITIDTSSFGSINMIKVIDGEIYVLNSTTSSIHKISGDSLITVSNVNITERDFVLDFEIDGKDIYYSNTYDEIFRVRDNSIIDTLKVFSPDKIAKIGNDLFITSRLNNEGQVIYSVDINSKIVNSLKLKSPEDKENSKFGQSSIAEYDGKVYVLDSSTGILSVIGTDLKIQSEIYLPVGSRYGNIAVIKGTPVILASENGKLAVYTTEVSLQHSKKTYNIDISNIDLRTSAIDKDKVYLYDYLQGKILIKNWKNN